jgi:transcription initiation factor TFIID subunit 10
MADNTQPPPNADPEMMEDLDATVEAEIDTENTQQPDAMNLDGANDTEAPQRNGAAPENPIEARIPAKKDATLREFLSKMDEFAPIVCAAPPWREMTADPPCRSQMQSPTTT